jgi:hypothetical protein
LRGAATALPCLVILGVAIWLNPARKDHGTHRQMGLAPCSFLVRHQYPCPTCGMTTSVASMVHGRVAKSWRAHPFGLVMTVWLLAAACAGLGELVTGRDWFRRFRPSVWWVLAWVVGLFAGWGLKLLIGFNSGLYPIN